MAQFKERQEGEGIAAPKRYEILDSKPEPAYDCITELAAGIFETPIAMISFQAPDGVLFKSAFGIEIAKNLKNTVICGHATESIAPLVIEDAAADQRFYSDPLVAFPPHIRFYAGAPLVSPEGYRIGTLSIADVKPKADFSVADADRLQQLAAVVVDKLESHLKHSKPGRAQTMGSALLAAMSHDIRTPMNGVLGMAELLLTAGNLDDRNRRRVEIIKRSGHTLLSMLDKLIELARIENEESAPHCSAIDLHRLVSDVHCQLQLKKLDKGLKFDLADSLENNVHIVGDAPRLQKLLSSYASSAMEFSAEDVIRVTIEPHPAGAGRVLVCFKAQIADINADTIERILGPFEQNVIPSPGGFDDAGLELIICRRLATGMEGDVCIDRSSSGGPIFRLDVAFGIQAEPAVSKNPSIAIAASGVCIQESAFLNVLVAEDNPDMALLVEELLEEAGYHAILAPDGASVLKILGERHVDVILMDGRMPDMTGFEVAGRIRQIPDERANVPIIALTADALAGDRERYLSAGMDDYVAKPIDFERLVAAIERCCH